MLADDGALLGGCWCTSGSVLGSGRAGVALQTAPELPNYGFGRSTFDSTGTATDSGRCSCFATRRETFDEVGVYPGLVRSGL